jgi:hypothetical protein
MNYKKHYDLLIVRAQERTIIPGNYSEKHHIHPRCLGGDDTELNLVRLFPEEHYVAHQLLARIHPQEHRLKFALVKMTGKIGERNNKCYGWVRRQLGSARKGCKASPETLQKLSVAAKGRKPSEQTRSKMSASMKQAWVENRDGYMLAVQQREESRRKTLLQTRRGQRLLWWREQDAKHR